jgi:acyl-coenzyme A thioesterase PaaI-like protein
MTPADFEAVRAGMEQAIPFNGHLGLKVVELSPGRGVVRLEDDARLRNHVGSQHAGALFSAGEAASGGAFVATFVERLGDVTPLAESAEIKYRRVARGPITATGTLSKDAEEIFEELESEGVVRFPVSVELTDGQDRTVAEMTVQWHVRLNDAG